MISAEHVRFELNAQPADYTIRFLQAGADRGTTRRLVEIKSAEKNDRPALLAQLAAYLAAAHALFPEESEKLYDFVKPDYDRGAGNG